MTSLEMFAEAERLKDIDTNQSKHCFNEALVLELMEERGMNREEAELVLDYGFN